MFISPTGGGLRTNGLLVWLKSERIIQRLYSVHSFTLTSCKLCHIYLLSTDREDCSTLEGYILSHSKNLCVHSAVKKERSTLHVWLNPCKVYDYGSDRVKEDSASLFPHGKSDITAESRPTGQ